MQPAVSMRRRAGDLIRAAFIGLLLGLGSCARPPEAISPTVVSPLKYQGSNCARLVNQVAFMDDQLARLYTQQRSNQANDTFKLLFFLHPRATVAGPDLVPSIALVKGERDAANAVLQARC